MSVIDYEDKKPKIDASVFLAPGSFVIGEVTIDEGTGIWNGAVVRGDDDSVKIGARATVLENCIVEALVGIGAIVLDGSTVGKGAIISTGAVVPPRTVIPPNTLALGIPAKPAREVRDGEMEFVAEERQPLTSKVEKYKKIFAE